MSDEEVVAEKAKIDALSHLEMAKLYRFAPSGHPYFDSAMVVSQYFFGRWVRLGGMTPELSKQIGWQQWS